MIKIPVSVRHGWKESINGIEYYGQYERCLYVSVNGTYRKKSLLLVSLFNRLDFVAVVRYNGRPSRGGCILRAPVWVLLSSPIAVMYEPSRNISSMVWRPRCLTPEKKPQTWSMTPGDIGSNLSDITSMSERKGFSCYMMDTTAELVVRTAIEILVLWHSRYYWWFEFVTNSCHSLMWLTK